MKKVLSIGCCLLLSYLGHAQYYYNDIVATNNSNNNYKLLKQNNIHNIKGVSYEADNTISENFMLEQELSRDRRKITTKTTSTNHVSTITISLYENDRLKKTTDSLQGVTNIAEYLYDASGRLVSISAKSVDPEHNGGNTTEVHEWYYNTNGIPESMLKIKNGVDSVKITFIYDEKGNVAEEQWRRKSRLIDSYYYYYNDNNQLTDVVHFNAKARKMLPDYVFEYDLNGRINSMMQTIQGTGNYLFWKYTYDERGLRVKEVCYNKLKQLVGKVEYAYAK
jgi:hypothetical protein